MTTINEQKQNLRQQIRLKRQKFFAATDGIEVAKQLQQHFLELNILREDSVIGGYWPYGAEAPILPLLKDLYEQGYTVVLPAVTAPNKPLEFRNWDPAFTLQKDICGICCPDAQQPVLIPTILLIPLMAFDKTGGRLGQGGGFYDLTIRFLRHNHPLLSIGVGYEIQKVDSVPLSPDDEKLEYILTEQRIYSV